VKRRGRALEEGLPEKREKETLNVAGEAEMIFACVV